MPPSSVPSLSAPHSMHRQAWSESERQEIRNYATSHPGSSCSSIKRWFEAPYPDTVLTQSQISQTLNPKRARGPSDADIVNVQKLLPTGKRMRRGKFPELDAALFEWQQVMQKRKIAITGYKRKQCNFGAKWISIRI